MSSKSFSLSAALLLAGCWQTESSRSPSPPVVAPAPVVHGVVPTVELVSDDEWKACVDAIGDLNGEPCDDQTLEGGVPLRYRHLPAIARDGSVLAVVEERDGWSHVRPGVRLIDRDGHSVQWLALDGTGDAARAAVERANTALATREWVAITPVPKDQKLLAGDVTETTLEVGELTAVYRRRSNGNWRLPPSEIRVTDAHGRIVAERSDTERAWGAEPACNMPSFELVGASARPGVLLFVTGLGMGGHSCDGVEQPPDWHVLAFGP